MPSSRRPLNRRNKATARVTEKYYRPLNIGQKTIWNSRAQVTAAVSGHGGGKSHLGAYWLLDQVDQWPGEDFIVCGPNFNTLSNSAIPKMRSLFALRGLPWEFDQSEQVGFRKADSEYWLPTGGVIYIRSGDRPGSMQGTHAKGAWMDEVVDTTFYVYETLMGRIALRDGRMLITTTPYDRGWLYEEVYKPWLREGGPKGNPGSRYCVAQWRSIDNSSFPKYRYEQLKASLPEWRFRMLYEGQFERPMGLVYDCFQDKNWIDPFPIPPEWPVRLGIDWGFHDPMACIWIARAPNGEMFAFDEFYETGFMRYEAIENEARKNPTAAAQRGAQSMRMEMVNEIITRCRGRGDNIKGVFCDHDPDLVQYTKGRFYEEMSIDKVFKASKEKGSLLAGIERNYMLVRQGRLHVFNSLIHFRDEVDSYSWKIDDKTGEIKKDEPKDTKNHLMDAWRYCIAGSPDEKVGSFGVGSLDPYGRFSHARAKLYRG